MNGNNYERTVDVTGFLKAVFAKWRWMLIFGIVMALVLGMIPVLQYGQAKSKGSGEAAVSTADENDQYITDEEYEEILQYTERNMASKKRYLADSYLMKIDPFNVLVARDYIYINLFLEPEEMKKLDMIGMLVGEAVSADGIEEEGKSSSQAESSVVSEPDDGDSPVGVNTEVEYLMTRVIGEYTTLLSGGIDWSELAGKLGTEEKYIRECVTTEVALDSAKITIIVKSYDKELADTILDYISLKMREQSKSISSKLCSHELIRGDRSYETIYDSTMRNMQENFISEIATSLTRYDNFKDARSNYVYKEKATARASLNKKAVLRNGIAGLLGGILIVFAFSAALVFLRGRVISAKELAMSYDLRILACLNPAGGSGRLQGVDRWLGRIGTGEEGKLSDEERELKAAQMTELYAGNAGTIVLTGDVSAEELKKVAEKLGKNLKGVTIHSCTSIPGNAGVVKESSGVILVEKKNESRLSAIETDIGIIRGLDIPIIGAILI